MIIRRSRGTGNGVSRHAFPNGVWERGVEAASGKTKNSSHSRRREPVRRLYFLCRAIATQMRLRRFRGPLDRLNHELQVFFRTPRQGVNAFGFGGARHRGGEDVLAGE